MECISVNKKGLSPLISTVLILSFTLVLIVLVFVFTGEISEEQIRSSEDIKERYDVATTVSFKIDSVNLKSGRVEVMLENTGNLGIFGFMIRTYSNSDIEVSENDTFLEVFNKKIITVPILFNKIDKIEVIPKVIVGGELRYLYENRMKFLFEQPGMGGCIPSNEICDNLDNDCDGSVDEIDCKNPFILVNWAKYIDVLDEASWNQYLIVLEELRNIGFTHAGIRMWNSQSDISSKINELRSLNFKLGLQSSSGHIILTSNLDPDSHASNGQNIKYFDSLGFDPYNCAAGCGSINNPNCTNDPHRTAHDPAYDGLLWQQELSIVENIINKANLLNGDLMLFDTEVWGESSTVAESCYPGALNNSVLRYSGNLDERYQQYYNYWKARGLDLRNKVKIKDQGIFVLFFNENMPGKRGWMPYGVGDARSPRFYFAPNLTKFQISLNEDDFSNTYPWISFSTTNYAWTNPPGDPGGSGSVSSLKWDPKITQKIGYMLRSEGVAGIIIYPGPGDHGLSTEYYSAHAHALVNGLVKGIDPGTLSEVCSDGMDNDGDGEWDEC